MVGTGDDLQCYLEGALFEGGRLEVPGGVTIRFTSSGARGDFLQLCDSVRHVCASGYCFRGPYSPAVELARDLHPAAMAARLDGGTRTTFETLEHWRSAARGSGIMLLAGECGETGREVGDSEALDSLVGTPAVAPDEVCASGIRTIQLRLVKRPADAQHEGDGGE